MTALDLETYRRRAEDFLGALDREHYEHFSGRKPVCDTAAVYERFPDLFTREAVLELDAVYEATADLEPKRQLAYLVTFAVDGYLGGETRLLADEIANTESAATIEVDGETIGLRQAGVVQGNEADAGRRARIQQARLEATDVHLNPLLRRLWEQSHELAVGLGYPDYMDLYSTVKGHDYLHLRAELEQFLAESEGVYERSMDRLTRERLGLTLDELAYSDLPYLWRAPGFDGVFTAERLVPSLRATLSGMGIDLDAQANVHLDTEVRPLKTPRAFCSPVSVPGEIYLVVLPRGGQDDYGALFHEAGHTEHFAHVDPALPFEYRYLGDNAVTEGFAFVLEHLLVNALWLEEQLGFTESGDYLRFAAVNDLYFMRRYAAKLAYETELHRVAGDLSSVAEVYSRKLTAATKVAVPPQNYLADVDDAFYCAEYLRAWMLEGHFRMMLQDRHGLDWFRSDKASAWLKQMWSDGQHWPAERLLLKHGGGRLCTDPLKHLFERVLGAEAPRSACRQHADQHAAPARPVELREEHALPGAQLQAPFGQRHGDAAAHQARLHVGVGVAFEVGEGEVRRHEPVESRGDVDAHRGVGVLVDGHARRGVWHVHEHRPVACAALGDRRLHLVGHVDERHAPAGPHLERAHGRLLEDAEPPSPRRLPAAGDGVATLERVDHVRRRADGVGQLRVAGHERLDLVRVAAPGACQAELRGDALGDTDVLLVEPAAVVDLHGVDGVGHDAFETGVVGGAAAPAARPGVHPEKGRVLRDRPGAHEFLYVAKRVQIVEVGREHHEVAEQRADLHAVHEQDSFGRQRLLEDAVVAHVAVIGEGDRLHAVVGAPGDVVAEADAGAVGGGVGVGVQVDVHRGRL